MEPLEGPKELFISYGREPHVTGFVHKLKSDLERNGFTVWVDLQDIPSGSDWHGAIGEGLYQCQAILPVITNKYLGSSYCIKELYTADGDGKLIFPLMFEDVDLDKDQTSQGVKFTISSINWTMCRPDRDDYNIGVSRLLHDLRTQGLGNPDYQGPVKKIQLGEQTGKDSVLEVGPKNTSEPLFVIPDAELVGGITTTPTGEIIFSSGAKHSITIITRTGKKGSEDDGEGEELERRSFGKCGIMEDEEMVSPAGLAVNEEGHVLVASQYHLKRFTIEGELLGVTGDYKSPEADETLQGPMGMALGSDGRVYIVETSKNRVKIFNSDFSFLSSFSKADKRLGSGHLNNPMNVATNSKGQVFVTDLSNNDIQVFSADGEYQFRFKKQGHGLGSVQSPMALAIDAQDYVYVASGTGTISIFEIRDKEAVFVKAFGSHGMEFGQFSTIRCMHIDREGKLYVGEMTSNRIQVFQ